MQIGTTAKQVFRSCWKKPFSSGDYVPTKIGNCEKSVKHVDRLCDLSRARTKQKLKSLNLILMK